MEKDSKSSRKKQTPKEKGYLFILQFFVFLSSLPSVARLIFATQLLSFIVETEIENNVSK